MNDAKLQVSHIAMFAALSLTLPAFAYAGTLSAKPDPCELHFFPAGNELASIQGAVSLLGLPFNLIDAASHGGSANRVRERMTLDLPPAVQITMLMDNEVTAALKLPANTVVVAETPIPSLSQLRSDPVQKVRLAALNAAIHDQRRLTTSMTPCYAELVASNVFVRRAPLDGTVLRVRWYFRNLGANPRLDSGYSGWSEVNLSGYTSTLLEQPETAGNALRKAFLASLVAWAAENLEKHPELKRQHAGPPGH